MPTTAEIVKPYVIVVHKATLRGFTLNGGYRLIDADVKDCRTVPIGADQTVTQTVDKWITTGDWQRPEWTRGMNDNEFQAYWLSKYSRN